MLLQRYALVIFLYSLTIPSPLLAEEILNLDTTRLYEVMNLPALNSGQNNTQEFRILFGNNILDLDCSPDRDVFAVSFYNGEVRIQNSSSGDEIAKIQAHNGPTRIAWYSSNGRVLATTGFQEGPRFWDVQTGDELYSSYDTPHSYPIVYGPKHIIFAGSDISVLNIETGEMQYRHLGFGGVYKQGVADYETNRLYIVTYNALYAFDVIVKGYHLNITQIRRTLIKGLNSQLNWLRVINDGETLILASGSGNLYQVNTTTFEVKKLDAATLIAMQTFDMDANGNYLVAGQFDFKGKENNATLENRMLENDVVKGNNDVVFKGHLSKGITHFFKLLTKNKVFACWRDNNLNEIIIGVYNRLTTTTIKSEY